MDDGRRRTKAGNNSSQRTLFCSGELKMIGSRLLWGGGAPGAPPGSACGKVGIYTDRVIILRPDL